MELFLELNKFISVDDIKMFFVYSIRTNHVSMYQFKHYIIKLIAFILIVVLLNVRLNYVKQQRPRLGEWFDRVYIPG